MIQNDSFVGLLALRIGVQVKSTALNEGNVILDIAGASPHRAYPFRVHGAQVFHRHINGKLTQHTGPLKTQNYWPG